MLDKHQGRFRCRINEKHTLVAEQNHSNVLQKIYQELTVLKENKLYDIPLPQLNCLREVPEDSILRVIKNQKAIWELTHDNKLCISGESEECIHRAKKNILSLVGEVTVPFHQSRARLSQTVMSHIKDELHQLFGHIEMECRDKKLCVYYPKVPGQDRDQTFHTDLMAKLKQLILMNTISSSQQQLLSSVSTCMPKADDTADAIQQSEQCGHGETIVTFTESLGSFAKWYIDSNKNTNWLITSEPVCVVNSTALEETNQNFISQVNIVKGDLTESKVFHGCINMLLKLK